MFESLNAPSQTNTPEQFASASIFISDFDGTEYDTFEPSPNGIGVNEAYTIAIEETFDFDKDALKKYEYQGGHQNRTPLEIVHSLAPYATPAGLERLSKEVVKAKLDVLLGQIGQPLEDGAPWPRPLPGFVDFWKKISAARKAGEIISTANISAGHNVFIKKCFEVSGLEYPDILVTDETIQGLYSSLPLEKLTKPSVLPFWLVKVQWVNQFAYNGQEFADLMRAESSSRMIYSGDDAVKDGGLAANANIPFILIDKDTALNGWRRVEDALSLGALATKSSIH